MATKLPAKQETFCLEYVVDMNATRAYMAAYSGSKEKAAAVSASRLLRKPKVEARIAELRAELAERCKLRAEDIVGELRKLGFWNIQTFVNGDNTIVSLNSLSLEATVPVAGIKVKEEFRTMGEVTTRTVTSELKLADKRGALVDLGRHLGIFEQDNNQKAIKIKVTRK